MGLKTALLAASALAIMAGVGAQAEELTVATVNTYLKRIFAL
jgi:hypothetical protein